MKILAIGLMFFVTFKLSAQENLFFLGTWKKKAIFQIDHEDGVTTATSSPTTVTFNKDNTGYFISDEDKKKRPFIWKYNFSPLDVSIITDSGRPIRWSMKQLSETELLMIATIDRKRLDMCDYYFASIMTKVP